MLATGEAIRSTGEAISPELTRAGPLIGAERAGPGRGV